MPQALCSVLPGPGRDVAEPRAGVAGDAQQHPGVAGQALQLVTLKNGPNF